MSAFDQLLDDVRACSLCKQHLPHGVRPVLQVSRTSKILIAGQAPGRRVHESGILFDDQSGDRLREWLGVTKATFYDASKIAILPMGFCYPGKGPSGDLPPRPECAPTWRQRLLDEMQQTRLILVIGKYAQAWHLQSAQKNLTETVKHWRDYAPMVVPLPHPSPRNNIWLKKNPWFNDELLPELAVLVKKALRS